MNNTTVTIICCEAEMREKTPEVAYLTGFPAFIHRIFRCDICNHHVDVDINDPCERERIAGHLLAREILAPICCLTSTQEKAPEIFCLSYPIEVFRIFTCKQCHQIHRFAVTDPAKRDAIASTLFSWEVTR